MQLNTSHALHGSLKFLIGVEENNQLVDLVTPTRTFAPHASSVFGSGPYGRHFGVRRSGQYYAYGASFSPIFKPPHNSGTLVVVVNNVTYGSKSHSVFVGPGGTNATSLLLPRIGHQTEGKVVASARNVAAGETAISAPSTSVSVGGGERMWAFVRDGTTSHAIYANGTLEVSGGQLGSDGTGGYWSYIGGTPGVASMDADIVWIAWFDKALTSQEVSELYASLGAGNTFGLVGNPDSGPVAFSGQVADQLGTQNVLFSLDVGSKFAGALKPFAYSIHSGTLPTALTLNVSTGVISGTPTTTGTASGVVVRATDSGSNTADTNPFSITINASDSTPPSLSDATGAGTGQSTASGSVSTDEANGTVYAVVTTNPTAPSVAQIQAGQSSSGAAAIYATNRGVSGAGSLGFSASGLAAATTYYWHFQQADVAGNQSSVITSAAFSTLSASNTATIIVPDPLTNNTGTVLANQTGVRVAVLRAMDLARVFEFTGITTNSSGHLAPISDVTITSGEKYHVVIKLADGSVGITGIVTAS